MRNYLTFAVIVAGVVVATLTAQPASADAADTSRQMQDSWARCLNASYAVTRTQTPDKSAAAEMAFQACYSEEQDLINEPYGALLQPHLRAETKRVLIDTDGHIPMMSP